MKKKILNKNEFLDQIIVAIPVYNEEKYLDIVIKRVQQFASNILFIDDGSTDKTPEILSTYKDISVIRHKTNEGYGRSLIDALNYAKSNQFSWIITMDCDLQHEPETLPLFYESIKEDKYDIISGSRYLEDISNSGIYPPESRMIINKEMTKLLKKTINLNITDSFCGFKAYRVDFIDKMDLMVNGYAFPLQIWVQVAKLAGRLTEIPVKMIYSDTMRSFGEILDNPQRRFAYYIDVLNQELDKNGYKKIKNVQDTVRKRCNTHIA